MCTVSRYEIGSNFVDASLSIYKMCEEKDEFGELSVWEKIKRVCNFFTSLGCAGNSAVALHDDRYYNKIDAGLNVVSLVDIGIETYQDVVDEEKRDTGGFLKLVARIVRVACSVLTLLPLPQPLPGIFSIVKTTAVYTCQFHTLFWNPFFIDPRTDSSLPFSEKDEKQFCQWVACFKSAQAYLCCITQRFIRRPVAYPDRDIHVDFGSIEDLRQRNVTQVMIIGKMYSLMEFSEASSEKVIQAERRYQMCRKLYSTFIRFRGGLKKCIDNDVFSEVSFRLLRNYSLSIKCCPIT